jgi:hypothetical protein
MSMIDLEFEELEALLPRETDTAAYALLLVQFDARESDIESALRSLRVSLVGTAGASDRTAHDTRYRDFCARLAKVRKARLLSTPGTRAAVANEATARAEASHALLTAASRQLVEATATGERTIAELERQGAQMQGSRDKLTQVNADLAHSNRLLTRMSQWFR